MADCVDIDSLPALPRDEDGPVFKEPWEAQAFAMTVTLHEAGHFAWSEWVEIFSAEIAAHRHEDDGSKYYEYWLTALEKIVAAKNILEAEELSQRKDEWASAVAHTDHGSPIRLDAAHRH